MKKWSLLLPCCGRIASRPVGGRRAVLWLNNDDGAFAAAVHYSTGDDPYSVAVGELDGGEWLDLPLANSGSNNASVLLKQGGRLAADVDGDGGVDLAD
jgi:hypothetical protein